MASRPPSWAICAGSGPVPVLVRDRVVGIAELVDEVGAGVSRAIRAAMSVVGMAPGDVRTGQRPRAHALRVEDLRATSCLGRPDGLVALLLRDQGQADAGVASGAFDQRGAGLDVAALLGRPIMRRPMRSLIEPPGFWLSSFRNRLHAAGVEPWTIGVGDQFKGTDSWIAGIVRRGADRRCRHRLAGRAGLWHQPRWHRIRQHRKTGDDDTVCGQQAPAVVRRRRSDRSGLTAGVRKMRSSVVHPDQAILRRELSRFIWPRGCRRSRQHAQFGVEAPACPAPLVGGRAAGTRHLAFISASTSGLGLPSNMESSSVSTGDDPDATARPGVVGGGRWGQPGMRRDRPSCRKTMGGQCVPPACAAGRTVWGPGERCAGHPLSGGPPRSWLAAAAPGWISLAGTSGSPARWLDTYRLDDPAPLITDTACVFSSGNFATTVGTVLQRRDRPVNR